MLLIRVISHKQLSSVMTQFLVRQPPYPWFAKQWQQFTDLVSNRRLPHALLLKSVDGMGTLALAEAMAAYLLCRSPMEDLSCGRCRGCELVAAHSHPDLAKLVPEEGSQIIKIAQVRELSNFVTSTAQQGGRKVIILAPAEWMNIEAANALLKNLEEPCGDTVFILASYQPARLLPTIRSRTSQIALSLPTRAQSLKWLNDRQVKGAEAVLDAVGGAPVKALEWLDGNQMEVHDDIAQCASSALSGQVGVVDAAKKLSSFDLPIVFGLVQLWLQRAIRKAQAGMEDDLPVVQNLAVLGAQPLYLLLDRVQGRMAQIYAGSNPNKALACEELLLLLQSYSR